MTAFSRLHPYPAMVADELATAIAAKYIRPNSSVLDPFCGSGRLLAAIKAPKYRLGIDANPLAWLLTSAKFAQASFAVINQIILQIDITRSTSKRRKRLSLNRKVDWFSADVLKELERIVGWINSLNLARPDLLLVAAALSGTVRDVSYARKGGWKLHRLAEVDRSKQRACPWDALKRRLTYCLKQLELGQIPKSATDTKLGDARTILNINLSRRKFLGTFDYVITSPPYGDSLTTVQYGAASSLCLSIVSKLKGLEGLFAPGAGIDNQCLGGGSAERKNLTDIKSYWAGSKSSKAGLKVSYFLCDYQMACEAIANSVKPKGKIIFIVGRRSTGGFRLKLDDFTIDKFRTYGFRLVCKDTRRLKNKRFPQKINRFGRSLSKGKSESGIMPTMDKEYIIVMRKHTTS